MSNSSAPEQVRLVVIVNDHSAAAHVSGALSETTARTFDLPGEIVEYIKRRRHSFSSIVLALDFPEKTDG